MSQRVDRVAAAHVGRRVVVRVQEGRGQRDTLGELVSLAPLVVRRDDGSLTELDPAAVVAAKPVPPRPPRRPSYEQMLDLERTAAKSWLGADHQWLGDWLLRAAGGFTSRGNSTLALGDPGCPLADALARVHRFYAERGLPTTVSVPLPVRTDLDDDLAARGWPVSHGALVLTSRLSPTVARTDLPPATVSGSPGPQWLAAYHYRGGTAVPTAAHELFAAGSERGFATVLQDGEVLAIGRVVADDGWAGVTAVEVGAAHRRRGLAGHVMTALAGWALARGIDRMWLQVDPGNTAALALYERLGYRLHHRYHYRVRP